MIIWSGWGFLVFVITFAVSLLAEGIVEAAFHDDTYYQARGWPLAVALACSAVVIWFLGRRLNAAAGRVVIDKETGREMVLGGPNRHRFFFMPMQYWGPLQDAFALASIGRRCWRGVTSTWTSRGAAVTLQSPSLAPR